MSSFFVSPWTVARQASLSMGFPRQEYWSGLPFPFPGDLPDPGIEPMCPALAGGVFTTEIPGKPSESLSPWKQKSDSCGSVVTGQYNPWIRRKWHLSDKDTGIICIAASGV